MLNLWSRKIILMFYEAFVYRKIKVCASQFIE